ncbi:MAG TPA: hypothetical protein VFG99_11870, partial [Chloroflexia bacterium]|nr:hypothetical protein [Chloroflexia bacterium]
MRKDEDSARASGHTSTVGPAQASASEEGSALDNAADSPLSSTPPAQADEQAASPGPTGISDEERAAYIERLSQQVAALRNRPGRVEPLMAHDGEEPLTDLFTLKPGHKTTEGRLVGAITAGLSVAAALNWTKPDEAQEWGQRISILVTNLLPLLALLPVVWHYITSRGKIKSNAIWATASAHNPLVRNDNLRP